MTPQPSLLSVLAALNLLALKQGCLVLSGEAIGKKADGLFEMFSLKLCRCASSAESEF